MTRKARGGGAPCPLVTVGYARTPGGRLATAEGGRPQCVVVDGGPRIPLGAAALTGEVAANGDGLGMGPTMVEGDV